MSAATIAGIALQLIAFSIVGFAAGDLLLRWSGLLPDRTESNGEGFQLKWVGITERALMSFVGFVAFSVVLMLLHIATRGHVFGHPGVVPVLTIAMLAYWFKRRERLPRPRPISYAKLGALLVVLVSIYAIPAFVSGSSVRTGDPPWHLGWTEQLLGGDPLPTGPAVDLGRNAYPWGLHATMSTMVRLAPGTVPLTALETLHLLLIAGLPIAAACLAFRLRPDGGWAAAGAAGLIGGFGWVVSGGPDFVTSPGNARFGADLVVASPNSVYELFPPALPRELGVILLGAAGLLCIIAARNRLRRVEILAGACAGLAGLVSVPMFMSSLVWMAVASLAVRENRWRYVKHTVGGAGLVFALWGLPVIVDYIRFDGFVNITPRLGKEWPFHIAAASWGLLLPLFALGVYLSLKRREVEDRGLLAFAAGTSALLLLSILRGQFEWDLWGNATLLHQGRVWPPLHLLGAVFGGAALMWIYGKIISKVRAAMVVVLILGVGAVSPLFASVHLTDLMDRGAAGFVYGGDDIQDSDSFINQAARVLEPADVVIVEGPRELAFKLFEFSGVRLATYDHPALETNDLRIRFNELADQWNELTASGEGQPTHLVLRGIPPGNPYNVVATGMFEGTKYFLMGPVGSVDR